MSRYAAVIKVPGAPGLATIGCLSGWAWRSVAPFCASVRKMNLPLVPRRNPGSKSGSSDGPTRLAGEPHQASEEEVTARRISSTEGGARLYRDLADWYPLLTPVEEYAEEASCYLRLFESQCRRPPRTLLDLGSGGGHNAAYLKATLTAFSDRSDFAARFGRPTRRRSTSLLVPKSQGGA